MKHRFSVLVLGATLALACNDPSKDKPKAEVAASATAAPAAATAAGAESLTLDAAASKVGFVGSKVTGSHEGSFGKLTGTISLVEADPAKSSISVEIDTDSVTSDDEKLTGHLKSPDFFDTAKFPKATFKSTSIKAGGENGATHTVTGNLNLHGVEKAITFPATITVTTDKVSAKAEFTLNRKDFQINYAGKADNLIRDGVVMKLDISASRKK